MTTFRIYNDNFHIKNFIDLMESINSTIDFVRILDDKDTLLNTDNYCIIEKKNTTDLTLPKITNTTYGKMLIINNNHINKKSITIYTNNGDKFHKNKNKNGNENSVIIKYPFTLKIVSSSEKLWYNIP